MEIILKGGAKVEMPDNPEKVKCRACGQQFIFAVTSKGHRMPIVKDPEVNGGWMSHFANCPGAKRFRRKHG